MIEFNGLIRASLPNFRGVPLPRKLRQSGMPSWQPKGIFFESNEWGENSRDNLDLYRRRIDDLSPD